MLWWRWVLGASLFLGLLAAVAAYVTTGSAGPTRRPEVGQPFPTAAALAGTVWAEP